MLEKNEQVFAGNVEDLIEKSWKKGRNNMLVQFLQEKGSLQNAMEVFPGVKEAFEHPLDTVDCSDGRVNGGGRKIGVAGSGMLLTENDRKLFIEWAKGKAKVLTTHDDCGAAKAKFATLSLEDIPEGIKTADEYGRYCGEKTAKEIGAKHNHLNRDEMASSNHNEVGLTIDQTGRFNSDGLEGFPPHFVCTGAGIGFSEEYVKNEVHMLTGIALGHHGFGERFDEENPFIIMVAANNLEELLKWKGIAEETLAEYGNRVRVDGFVRPDSAEKN